MEQKIRCLVVAVVISCTLFVTGCTETKPPPAEVVQKEISPPLEYQLAVIDNGYVEKTDEAVYKMGAALAWLDDRCKQNEQEIADITVITQNSLKELNISTSLYELMMILSVEINKLEGSDIDYMTIAATYVVLNK